MLETINNIVWGPGTVILIFSCGVFFTVKTGFFQLRFINKTVLRGVKKNISSPFRALSAALAGTIGTGNIAGVATSIALGGPGAVFWMIVSAFFGTMTKFAEVVLAVKFRKKDEDGEFSGGPMYYMEKGLGQRWLGVFFAILMAASAFGIGNMVQSNSVSSAFSDTFAISPIITGSILSVLCFFVIIGGAKMILNATEIIVPVMAFFYLAGTVIFLMKNSSSLPIALSNILDGAFSKKAIVGGAGGFTVSKAIKYGIARGVFTNEAGLGSSPVAHASAKTSSPVEQGMWGIFEVFFDTVIMCTLTALVILTAGNGEIAKSGLSGMELTICAFESVYGDFGGIFISISIAFFAFATILGWCLYGEKAVLFITNDNKTALLIYKVFYTAAIYFGAIFSLETVWSISDTLNGLMAIPNIVTLFLLSKYVFEEIKRY